MGVIARGESPADFGYQVRVGARFPLESTATGAVLSWRSPDAAVDLAPGEAALLADGYLARPDPKQAGITDVSVAIRGARGETIAALTVPYVGTSYSEAGLDAAGAESRSAAAAVSPPAGAGT